MLKNSKIKLNPKLECNAKIEAGANYNKLNCFYANARSVVNKLEELELYVHEEKTTYYRNYRDMGK